MYNYTPIGIYSVKALADEEKEEKESMKDSSLKEKQQSKTGKNLLIVVEPDGMLQFDDTYNTIWEVRHIPSFANYACFVDLCKRFKFKNIAVVHYGNNFSDHTYPDNIRVVMNANFLSILTKSFAQFPEKDLLSLDDEYFESFRKETEKYFQGGLLLK